MRTGRAEQYNGQNVTAQRQMEELIVAYRVITGACLSGCEDFIANHATRDILMAILNDEDAHMDEIEELRDQIEQMTLPIFLTTQTN